MQTRKLRPGEKYIAYKRGINIDVSHWIYVALFTTVCIPTLIMCVIGMYAIFYAVLFKVI